MKAGCTSVENTCVSHNLELGKTRLEIQVKPSYTSIESTYISQNLEMGGARLKIWIETGW